MKRMTLQPRGTRIIRKALLSALLAAISLAGGGGSPAASALHFPPASAEIHQVSSLTLPARPLAGSPLPHYASQDSAVLMSEDFEGVFPSGLWTVFDADGLVNGEYYWGMDDYRPHNGTGSAWPARSGANGQDPAARSYADNMQSWMLYGPFDLSDASAAELLFYYWNRSERDYDWFGWYASSDGLNFHGTRVSGLSAVWTYVNFDLTAVPILGDLTGDSSVWIAFVFTSDLNNMEAGPFVDDIVLQKHTASMLSVSKTGPGSGTVTSDPAGIHCGPDCSEAYPWSTTVTLTAAADPGSLFTGWDEPACAGTGPCALVLTAGKSMAANFIPQPPVITVTYRSAAAPDGWLLESSEISGRGGSANATAPTLLVGDDASDRQYRSILSFNTAALPDNAVITSAILRLRSAGIVGTNPFLKHGSLVVDVSKGPFGGSTALQPLDFQTASSKNAVMTITNNPAGGWYTKAMGAAQFTHINKAGLTQFRLRFAKDDDDNRRMDALKLYSANYATASLRPQLVIKYYILP